jgi:hypothetical protein
MYKCPSRYESPIPSFTPIISTQVMGKAKDVLKIFIAEIPAGKLSGFPNKAPATLYTDNDYRLDLQSVRQL